MFSASLLSFFVVLTRFLVICFVVSHASLFLVVVGCCVLVLSVLVVCACFSMFLVVLRFARGWGTERRIGKLRMGG